MANQKSPNVVAPTDRIKDILRLLELTPSSAELILLASETFGDPEYPGRFETVERVRSKMSDLASSKPPLVRVCQYAVNGRRPMNFYHLTREGYRILHECDPAQADRPLFEETAVLSREHMFDLARLIVHTLVSAHRHGVRLLWTRRENAFAIAVGERTTKPDFSAVFGHDGMRFNAFFERDRGTEPIHSHAKNSIRTKLLAYEAYQDHWLAWWKGQPQEERGQRPRIRIPFLTDTMERAHHILFEASMVARNPRRLLCYATTLDMFLTEQDALRSPIFLDHHGHWQALVNGCPWSQFLKTPVEIRPPALQLIAMIC